MCAFLLATGAAAVGLVAIRADAADPATGSRNEPARLEHFRDLGFGLFIHWGVDSQLGSVISHSLVGASDDYVRRFFTDLPRTFDPTRFDPAEWAALAKLAGVRYVMFTTKHHSGFCMWDTKTTDFDVLHTPFRRDVTAAVLAAFRAQGIEPGVYFSPDDFWWLHQHGISIQRGSSATAPAHLPGLMAYDRAQLRELLTNYGPIDYLFIDGPAEGLRDYAWDLRPELVVTRGAITTPEQYVPGVPLDAAWEANLTMGTQWQYKPTNEHYKSGGELISLLVETRAKGGNLLLNVGPKPDGTLPIEQEERLREIALWMFINRDCIYDVRPWVITNEGDIWFTRHKDSDTLYAIVKQNPRWPYGQWRDVVLRSVRATAQTTVSVLGQNDTVIEYRPGVTPKTTFEQRTDGLHVRAMRAQRIYNNRQWPNPVVIKLTHVEPALVPPRVDTSAVRCDATTGAAVAEVDLQSLGDQPALEVGLEYRDATAMDATERLGATWQAAPPVRRTAPGAFSLPLAGLASGHTYDVRAVVHHPLFDLYGRELHLHVP